MRFSASIGEEHKCEGAQVWSHICWNWMVYLDSKARSPAGVHFSHHYLGADQSTFTLNLSKGKMKFSFIKRSLTITLFHFKSLFIFYSAVSPFQITVCDAFYIVCCLDRAIGISLLTLQKTPRLWPMAWLGLGSSTFCRKMLGSLWWISLSRKIESTTSLVLLCFLFFSFKCFYVCKFVISKDRSKD